MTLAAFPETNQPLILMAVDALASAPHFTQAQKNTRAEAVVTAVMAFLPAEPVQTMLAIQGVGHHFTLLDTFKEIAIRAPSEAMSTRLLAITTAQTKTTLALIKELRIVRKDMTAAAEDGRASLAACGTQTTRAEPPPPAETLAAAPTDPSPPSPTPADAPIAAHAEEIAEPYPTLNAAPEDVRALNTPIAEKATPPCLNRAQRRALRHLAAALPLSARSREYGAARRPASARQ